MADIVFDCRKCGSHLVAEERRAGFWQTPPCATNFHANWKPTRSLQKVASTQRKRMLMIIGSLLIVLSAGAKEFAVPKKTIFVPIFKGEKMKQPIREVKPSESYEVLSPTELGYIVSLQEAPFYPPIGYINRERGGYRLADEDNSGDVLRIIIRYQMNGTLWPGYIPFEKNIPYEIAMKTEKQLHLLYSFGDNVTTGIVSVADCSIMTSQQISRDIKTALDTESAFGNEQAASRPSSYSESGSFQLKTRNGVLERCRISNVEPDGITFVHSKGVSKLPFHELPLEYAVKYKYDPAQATQYSQMMNSHYAELTAKARQRERESSVWRNTSDYVIPDYSSYSDGGDSVMILPAGTPGWWDSPGGGVTGAGEFGSIINGSW